jgi:hypothetical protein
LPAPISSGYCKAGVLFLVNPPRLVFVLPPALKAGVLAGFGQRFERILPVHLVQKDVLPAVTPAQDVVNGTRIFHSYFSRYGAAFPLSGTNRKQNEPAMGDPIFAAVLPAFCRWMHGGVCVGRSEYGAAKNAPGHLSRMRLEFDGHLAPALC